MNIQDWAKKKSSASGASDEGESKSTTDADRKSNFAHMLSDKAKKGGDTPEKHKSAEDAHLDAAKMQKTAGNDALAKAHEQIASLHCKMGKA